MPFFDFLDDVGGFISSAAASAGKKKKQPTVEIPPERAALGFPESSIDREMLASRAPNRPTVEDSGLELGGEAQPTPFKGMISPEHSAFLQQQNAKASELKTRAAGILREAQAMHNLPPDKLAATIAAIEAADINTTRNLAQIVKDALEKRAGVGASKSDVSDFFGTSSTPLIKKFAQFEKDNEDFNRTVFKNPVPVTPPAIDPKKIEATQQGLDTALENMAVAATDEKRKFWSKQADDLRKTLNQFKQRVAEPRTEVPPAEQQPNPGGAVRGPAKTAGVSPEDFDDAVGELSKKLGLNLDEKVEFPLALDRLLNSPDFADVRDEWGALSQPSQQAPGVGEMGEAAKAAQGAQQGQRVDLNGDINRKLIEVAQSRQWNWGEAIAFVLLSMLIKPAATVMLWHRASKTGELNAELQSMLMERKERALAKEQQAEIAKEKRRQAAELQKALAVEGFRQYGQEKDDRRTFRKEWLQLVFKAANTRQKAQADPIAKAFQDDMENWLKLAGEKSRAMKYDEADLLVAKAMAMQERLREYLGLPAFEEEVAK